jgi:4-hydroxy-3-methylbut-2-enyl diphosphate reductase
MGVTVAGVTSGASVPEAWADGVLEWLAQRGFDLVEEVEPVRETLRFSLPLEPRGTRK